MSLDFATVMVLLVVVSGLIWAFDSLVLAPRRRQALAMLGDTVDVKQSEQLSRHPVLVEYARSFFPIFIIVLILRSFVVEPFRIPSGSMMPTLLIGDFILVNKFNYGIRLPVLNSKVIDIGAPSRGDIVVFRYPEDPSIPFIKRVVGLPGDEIAYYDKTLYINGKPSNQTVLGTYSGNGAGAMMTGASLREESLDGIEHEILLAPDRRSLDLPPIVVPEGIGAPSRGDIVVFRYPEDPSIPFIKRVVGLPGDEIAYYDKTLYINGKPSNQTVLGTYSGNFLLREALAKLRLNDAALHYELESSEALGFGFRCGFLGMLHMEIVQERLEREYGLNLITTAPTVIYEVLTARGKQCLIDNPAQLPAPDQISEIREPIIRADILVPQEHVGKVISLCIEKRGVQKKLQYLGNQVSLSFELPMSEVVLDFFDRLKSVSRGYASFDYSFLRFHQADMVKVDILINGAKVDALSTIVHRDQIRSRGRELTERMKELIPRQMFDVAIQAAIGSHIVARETVKALRKNVTAKCYGGDVTRKRKLLEKQKAGKKRMKQFGSVEIPQEAFMAVLQVGKKK